MNRSADELADIVNQWCQQHGVVPANGQAGERITVRNIRYYRTLGLLDPPALGGQGFSEKHRLQLVAIRLLQARGLPLNRIQELLFGRSIEDLQRIETEGLTVRDEPASFRPLTGENWNMIPLDDEFLLISRRGRNVTPEMRERVRNILTTGNEEPVKLRRIHEEPNT